MYVPDTLDRMDEAQTIQFAAALKTDSGEPQVCDYCSEEATEGIVLYNPADAVRNPPVTGVYGIAWTCDDCREYLEETYFYCECGKWFIQNHSWDVVGVMTAEGWKCQKCASEDLEPIVLRELLIYLENGHTEPFQRINSVPGKELVWKGEYSNYSDFALYGGHTSLKSVAESILEAAGGAGLDKSSLVYPIVDHGYQFSVSLAVYA